MNRAQMEKIIAEEIQALDEGAFEDAVGKVKGFFGKGKEKAHDADRDKDGDIDDEEAAAWNEISPEDKVKPGAYGKKGKKGGKGTFAERHSIPDDVAHGDNPLPTESFRPHNDVSGL